jgi:hypothetical protein
VDVLDLKATRASSRPWLLPGGSEVDPKVWAVNYLIRRGWLAHEVVHLVLEHGSWRGLGKQGAPAKVRAFVRDISIGALPEGVSGAVMTQRPKTVKDILEKLEEDRRR